MRHGAFERRAACIRYGVFDRNWSIANQDLPRISCLSRPVIHAHADDSQCSRRELCGAAAHDAVALHVVHLAVKPFGQPGDEMLLILSQLDGSDAQGIEPQCTGAAQEPAFQGR